VDKRAFSRDSICVIARISMPATFSSTHLKHPSLASSIFAPQLVQSESRAIFPVP